MMKLFDSMRALVEEVKLIEPWIIDIRRRLHQVPELLYDLRETSGIVEEELNKLSIEFQSGIAETGIVATIGKGSECIMLRADMDALPIEERADVEFKSRNKGVMHACGHDCHTAMLLGAARILKEKESLLDGTVKLCFQPAEEGGAGAKRMCDEGVMRDPQVSKVFGLHVLPMIPTGQLAGRSGYFLAATNAFEIILTGKGGHAAIPHLAIDPIPTAAKIILSAQTLTSREQNPLEPAVLSFTAVESGTAHNVIPESVVIKGTIRALTAERKDELKQRLRDTVKAIAGVDGCKAEFVTVGEDYPALYNDPELWDSVYPLGQRIVGEENFILSEPVMGGEDFAYYGAFAPTSFVMLGCGNEAKNCIHGLHHPSFTVDENAFHIGAALHLAFVENNF